MKSVRLFNSGGVDSSATFTVSEDGSSLEKEALLVYPGKFMSMDGEVDVTEEQLKRMVENHNARLSKLEATYGTEVAMRYFPPLQVDHSTSGWDTVGRVVGKLSLNPYKLEDGTEVQAVHGKIKVLGKENVERVKDGRWTNLSIGADLEEGKLSELTITPFPAAAEAAMLSSKRTNSNDKKPLKPGVNMFKRLKAFLMGEKKMSEEEAMKKMAEMDDEEKKKLSAEAEEKEKSEKKEKLKKHMMEKEDAKMSAEEADEKLSKMSDEEIEEAIKEHEEAYHQKQMSKMEEDKKELSAKKERLTQLSMKIKSSEGKVNLTIKKSNVLTKLSQYKAEAKITPAELKKLDLNELAGLDDKALSVVLSTYEKRQPVIMTGAFGSTKTIDLSKLEEKKRLASLEADIRKNMPSLRRMQEGEEGKKEIHVDINSHKEEKELSEGAAKSYDELCKMIDEDKKEDLKQHLKKLYEMMDSGTMMSVGAKMEEVSKEAEASLKELQEHHKELSKELETI